MINPKDKCYGCGLCEIACPVDAISIKEIGGFWMPIIDDKVCVNCSKCSDVCPVYVRNEKELPRKIYYSKTKNIEKNSSSGGLSAILARATIKNDLAICVGGVVVLRILQQEYEPNIRLYMKNPIYIKFKGQNTWQVTQ